MAGQQGPAGTQYEHLEEVGDWFMANNCDEYPQSSSLVPKLFHTVVSEYLYKHYYLYYNELCI